MWIYNNIFFEFKKLYKKYYRLSLWQWLLLLFPLPAMAVCLIGVFWQGYELIAQFPEIPKLPEYIHIAGLISLVLMILWGSLIFYLDKKGVFAKKRNEFDNEYVKGVVEILNEFNFFSSDGIDILVKAAKQEDATYSNRAWISAGFLALMLAGEVPISPMKFFESLPEKALFAFRLVALAGMAIAAILFLLGNIESRRLKNAKSDFLFVLLYIDSDLYKSSEDRKQKHRCSRQRLEPIQAQRIHMRINVYQNTLRK